ncbi:hypothetical protein AVEN_142840-1 [Araneus ventricosus]|uniref:Histone-lysine N-methyltransferase SETMAR n=1 Tax=Araneus ventricosus TaxID=182803 RepID=A0A4Y2XD15_ARAVE|nr:hypothetical protein AVEN_142840-1 [Araneus ventricosus]
METKCIQTKDRSQLTPLFDHPPYSPDIAPSDFHLFLKLKEFPGDERFESDEELENAVTTWLNELAEVEYGMGILELVYIYIYMSRSEGSFRYVAELFFLIYIVFFILYN